MQKQKGKKTQKKIIDAAVKCLSEKGVHQTTFQMIADESGISQPLIMHYFKKKEDIFPVVWNHIYEEAVIETAKRLKSDLTPVEKLREYFLVSWDLFYVNKDLTKIYIQFYFLSAFDEKLKAENSLVKRTAINRIASIIIEGQNKNYFNLQLNPHSMAKIIHISLSGFILNHVSEFVEFEYSLLLDHFFETILLKLKK